MATEAPQNGSRIDYLAKHKTLVPGHLQDRRSVYWVDREPLGPPTVFAMTPRLEVLSQSRHMSQYKFNRDRTFHINKEPFYREIKPTEGSKVPEASPRVVTLSAHKNAHSDYQYDRLLPTETKAPTDATPRVQELARSKTEIWQKKHGGWENEKMYYTFLPQPVSRTAIKATSTPRVETLAEHKQTHNDFKPERPVRWDIDERALKINASLRVCQLARPRSRNMVKDDNFDPYFVTKAARSATITPRVEELAVPLPRKCRSKKA